jgi:uncharacterized membrane protein
VSARVARVLLVGGLVSVALMLAGLLVLEAYALTGDRALDVPRLIQDRNVLVSLPELGHALRRWPPDPVALMTAGIVLLLLTPMLALAAALTEFVRERDSTYAIIAAALIVALMFGFAFRLGG